MRTFGASQRYVHPFPSSQPLPSSNCSRLLVLTCSLGISPFQVAKLFADSATIALTSFISPYRADRQIARDLHANSTQAGDDPLPFIEVFVDVPLAEAEKRDPKGLYKKARAGEIKDFTGISAPYEAPESPEITIRTDLLSVEECVKKIVDYLAEAGLISETKETR